MIERLYFGADGGGHAWHPREAQTAAAHRSGGYPEGCPFGYDVDGYVQPDTYQPPVVQREDEGRCRLEVRVNGTGPWTCIGWWDRSVDTRYGSCSAFVVFGGHEFPAMLTMLKETFPWVLARCKFPLVLVDEPARPRSRR